MKKPIKIPLPMLYESLYKDFKKLKIEAGKDKAYILELEHEIRMLKALKNSKEINKELKKELIEFKKSSIHNNHIKQIKTLTKERNEYQLLWDKALTQLNKAKLKLKEYEEG